MVAPEPLVHKSEDKAGTACASFLPRSPGDACGQDASRWCWAGSRAPQTKVTGGVPMHTHNEDGSQTPAQVPRTNHRTERAAGPTRVALSLEGLPGPLASASPTDALLEQPHAPGSTHPQWPGWAATSMSRAQKRGPGPPYHLPHTTFRTATGHRGAGQRLDRHTGLRLSGGQHRHWVSGRDTETNTHGQSVCRRPGAGPGGEPCRTPALSEGLRDWEGRGAGAGHSEAPWRRLCSPEKLRVASMVVRMAPWGETHSWGCLQAQGPRQASAAAPSEPPTPRTETATRPGPHAAHRPPLTNASGSWGLPSHQESRRAAPRGVGGA